jgi:hypothetical protein
MGPPDRPAPKEVVEGRSGREGCAVVGEVPPGDETMPHYARERREGSAPLERRGDNHAIGVLTLQTY